MKAYAKKIIAHPLFSGSAIMILGSNLANFFAYVYHFVVGRLLSPDSYGELGALLSLIGLLAVSMQFLGLVIVKFISSSKDNELASIYSWFMKLITKLSVILGVVFVVVSPLLSNFLHINITTIMLISPILVIALFSFFYRSVLQGLLRFNYLVISSNFEIVVRLVTGVLLIIIGWAVFGAMVGFVIGGAVSTTVKALVDDIINPLIGLLLSPAQTLTGFVVNVGSSTLKVGDFLNNVINLAVIMVVVYFALKIFRLDRLDKTK